MKQELKSRGRAVSNQVSKWCLLLLLLLGGGEIWAQEGQLLLTISGAQTNKSKIGFPSFIHVATNSCGQEKYGRYRTKTDVGSVTNFSFSEQKLFVGLTGDQDYELTTNVFVQSTTFSQSYSTTGVLSTNENSGSKSINTSVYNYYGYGECMIPYVGATNSLAAMDQFIAEGSYDNLTPEEQAEFDSMYQDLVDFIEEFPGCSIVHSDSCTSSITNGNWSPICYGSASFSGSPVDLGSLSPTEKVTGSEYPTAGGREPDPQEGMVYGWGVGHSKVTETLSDEYSTGDLVGAVNSALSGLEYSQSANKTAYAAMEYEELSMQAGKMKYLLSLQTKPYRTYSIVWFETTTETYVTNCTNAMRWSVVTNMMKITGDGSMWTKEVEKAPPSVGYPVIRAEISVALGCSSDSCGACSTQFTPGSNSAGGDGGGGGDENTLLALSIGADGFGGESGTLSLTTSSSTNVLTLTDPANLQLVLNEDLVTATTNIDDVIIDVSGPQSKVVVDIINEYSYQMLFYNVSNGIPLTNGGPFVTWGVTNVGQATNFPATIRVTETRGASSSVTDFAFDTNGRIATVTSGNGLRKISKTESWNASQTEQTITWTTLRPSDDAILDVRSETYSAGRVIESSRGIGADKVVDTYGYSADGLVVTNQYHDGGGVVIFKDGDQKTLLEFSPFQSSAVTTNVSNCRVREYSYTPVGTGDDGSVSPGSPRRVIEKVLGTEVARSYSVYKTNETQSIVCAVPGAAWDDASNLVTWTSNYDDGDFLGWTKSVIRPDGVLTLYEYEYDVATNFVTTVYTGAPNGDNTSVTNGMKTVTVQGPLRETISVSRIDIASNILIGQETYSEFDAFKRPGKVTYLDGGSKLFTYSCCNLESETDENGIETVYSYDALKRRTSVTRSGVSSINTLDAANRTVAMWRQGTNSTLMLMSSNVFNTAGELVTSYDALENETDYSRSVDGSGVRTETVTYPDLSTGVTTYFRDGSRKSVGGTARHGVRWEYGVETDGGVARLYTKELKLLTNGTDSSEWMKTYTDAVRNSYKRIYPDEAAEVTYFNSKGQAWKSVDADGVVRLSQYNAKGQQEYMVLDVNRNDTVDFSGTDRITRMLTYVTNAHGVDVMRSEMWQWQASGVDTPVLLSTSDRSVETKESWQFAFGLTNYSIHVCATNLAVCYSTNFAPDGSYLVSVAQNGLPLSGTRYDSNGVQLAQQSMGYDEFNRTITMTDARTGTITNTLDALGRTLTRTTPAPAPGQNPQTTQTDYDVRGRLWRVIEPDGGVVVTTYHPTGELKRKAGNRTYPVDYTYDYAGRMKTLKTWQDFEDDSGAAVTTWNYDSQRGFMTSKRYADNKGPDYEYTLTGKLAKRTWARGVETDYTYNDAGDLTGVDYSDSTPDVIYTYDRVGRKVTMAQGTQDAVTLHYTATGQLAAEQHTSGLLAGITVTNAYDGLLRRTGLTVLTNGGNVYQALYGFDAASRMLTVSDGTNNATYGYVTNSILVAEIAFKQNSTLRMTTTKQYDFLNRLTNISSTTTTFTNSFAYLYNDANQRTKATREDGSYWNYGYDDLGQVTSGKRYWADNTPVSGQQYDYDFDDIGNRKSATQNAKPEIRNSLYTANLLNQYTSRTVPGYADVLGTAHSNATVTVNYERTARKGEYWHKELVLSNQGQSVYAGVTNIAVLNDGGSPDIVTTNTGKLFLAKTPEQFTYDDDGNLTGDGRWAYTWDGENRLIQMETKASAATVGTPKQKLEFAYDDQWRRIQKKVSDWNGASYTASYTNRFAYDGWNLLTVFNPASLREAFLWGKDLSGSQQGAGGVGGLIAISESVNDTHFVAFDGNGNVVSLAGTTDASQSAVYEYSPFGELVRLAGTFSQSNPFRFSTKYQDQETTLLYYGYRYFTSTTGRWLSRDPISEKGGVNLQGFVGNDPLNQYDVFGLAYYLPKLILGDPWHEDKVDNGLTWAWLWSGLLAPTHGSLHAAMYVKGRSGILDFIWDTADAKVDMLITCNSEGKPFVTGNGKSSVTDDDVSAGISIAWTIDDKTVDMTVALGASLGGSGNISLGFGEGATIGVELPTGTTQSFQMAPKSFRWECRKCNEW